MIRPPDATYCIQQDPLEFVIISTYDEPLAGSCKIERLNADDEWEAAFLDSEGEVQYSCILNLELPPSSETRLTWPDEEKHTDLQVSVLRLSCRFLDLQMAAAEEQAAYERKLQMLEKQIAELEELGDVEDARFLGDFVKNLKTDGSSEVGASPTQCPPTPIPEPAVTPTPTPGGPPFLVSSVSFNAVLCK